MLKGSHEDCLLQLSFTDSSQVSSNVMIVMFVSGISCPPVYMTTHQHDSSQPQQSHDSPHFGAGEGLMMVETEEATLAGIVMVFV